MKQFIREQVTWPQPFPAEEYADRRRRVRAALQAAGLDAILVTAPANITWLTGYDMIWYHLKNLTGLLVRADSDDTVFFDSVAHTTIVSITPEIRDIVYVDGAAVSGSLEEAIAAIKRGIADRGLAKGKIGLEMWGYAPHASTMAALADGLRSGGATVEDHWTLVERQRAVKSPLEVQHVRKAAEIGDTAMAAARDAIRPGVMETEIEAVIMGTMMKLGGGYPGVRTMLGAGPRSGTHHSPPTRRKIQQGELVFVDFCGCYDRYHVNVNRTFSLGKPDSRWTDLMNTASGCIDDIISKVKVGDPLSKVDDVAQRYIDEAGIRKYVWWVGGYTQEIAVPPDWCGNYWLSTRYKDMGDPPIKPGMVFNLENQFDVWDNWPGGSGCAYIESLLVTENGLEVLSKLPRTLVTV
ncbi:MAG: Xaa-Pro peptidase family protein [Rhodospirillaceae bacterium]|nr:Xaa-Pro peptidase family protein [Rhodospirillaceae bacterium]